MISLMITLIPSMERETSIEFPTTKKGKAAPIGSTSLERCSPERAFLPIRVRVERDFHGIYTVNLNDHLRTVVTKQFESFEGIQAEKFVKELVK